MTNFEQMRQHLLHQAGIIESLPNQRNIEHLRKTEWSPPFEQLMRNRLVIGALRYGPLHTKKPRYDRIKGALKRLQQYQANGNLECLVDVANMMLLEFEEGTHSKRHWADIQGDHCCI